jgi:23S rRNA (guanosine2251-2'-O)-methyltransferase
VIRHEPAARIPRASSDSLIYGMRSVRTLVEVDPGRVVRLVVDGGRDKEEPLAEVVALAEEAGVRVQRVGRDEMALMARNAVHQGLLAEVAPFRYAEVEDLVPGEGATGVEQPLLLVLDGVTDPQNLGAAARAAWALGACGLILPKDRAAPVTAAAEKVASGALAFLKVASVTNLTRTLTDLKRDGVWVVGLDVDGEAMLHDQDLTVPVALVIGSEDEGMRRLTRETCDVLCRIPMAHDEAVLNAADAAAVALYEARRQRATVDTDVVDDLDLDGEE